MQERKDLGWERGAAERPAAGRRPGGKPTLRRLSTANLRSLSLQDLSRKLETTKLHAFTLDELKAATKNFSTTNFLGEGGFGPVYKGFVDGRLRPGLQPQHVAVKYLDSDGVQGHREWLVRSSHAVSILFTTATCVLIHLNRVLIWLRCLVLIRRRWCTSGC